LLLQDPWPDLSPPPANGLWSRSTTNWCQLCGI